MADVEAHGRARDRSREGDMEDEHEDHGHSTAAWTGVGIILLGSAIASVAVLLPNLLLGIIGALLAVPVAAVGLLILREVAQPRLDAS